MFGVITMSSLKQELIPSIEFPQITVISSMPGASPEVVDKQISAPLETALNSVEGLESTSSTSRNGVSQISLAFTYGSNLDRARNQIDRAISNAKQALPKDVQPQAIAGSISDFPIVFLAVSSDKPLSELNADLARLSVPALQKLDGVRGADVTGGATQHIQILPRPRDLAAIGREPPVHQRRAEEQRCTGPGRHHRGTGQDPLAADRQPGGLPRRHQGPPPGRGPRCGDDRQRGGRQPGRGRAARQSRGPTARKPSPCP